MRRLPITSAVEALRRMHAFRWSWTTDDLAAAMKAAGLVLHDPIDDMTIPFQHPELPGVDGFVTTIIGDPTVVDVSVTLAEVADEANPDARADHQALFARCHAQLSADLGQPDEPRGKGGPAEWRWDDDLLELRNLGITVVVTLIRTASRRKREGG